VQSRLEFVRRIDKYKADRLGCMAGTNGAIGRATHCPLDIVALLTVRLPLAMGAGRRRFGTGRAYRPRPPALVGPFLCKSKCGQTPAFIDDLS
jgi:hypothetical protein